VSEWHIQGALNELKIQDILNLILKVSKKGIKKTAITSEGPVQPT
jgi:hypothetical protein